MQLSDLPCFINADVWAIEYQNIPILRAFIRYRLPPRPPLKRYPCQTSKRVYLAPPSIPEQLFDITIVLGVRLAIVVLISAGTLTEHCIRTVKTPGSEHFRHQLLNHCWLQDPREEFIQRFLASCRLMINLIFVIRTIEYAIVWT